MLRDAMILSYCGAVGFASAGTIASLFRLVTSEPARFVLLGKSWLGAFSSFLFFAFTGPAILASIMLRRLGNGDRSPGIAVGGIAVALLWSVCSGLIVLEFALAVRRDLF